MENNLRSQERTVKAYPWFVFFVNCHFWGPVFFLYFSSRCSASQVLLLEAIYYCSISMLELPSGYFSDRKGRRKTLLIACLFLCISFFLFFTGTGFAVFALAQLFLAGGFAFLSGTDTAIHYEALSDLGRENEFLTREARASSMAFAAGAVSALGGGLAGLFQMRYAYAASCIAGLCALFLVTRMGESRETDFANSCSFAQVINTLLKKACRAPLKKIFLFSIFMTVAGHIPYEFYQPYLKMSIPQLSDVNTLITGLHLALTMIIGACAARSVSKLKKIDRFWPILMGCAVFTSLMICGMATIIHPAMAILLMMRTVPRGIYTPILNWKIAPELENSERSTYLSLQSLCGRLAYGAVLLIISGVASRSADPLSGAISGSAWITGLLLTGLAITVITGSDRQRS